MKTLPRGAILHRRTGRSRACLNGRAIGQSSWDTSVSTRRPTPCFQVDLCLVLLRRQTIEVGNVPFSVETFPGTEHSLPRPLLRCDVFVALLLLDMLRDEGQPRLSPLNFAG